MVEFLRALAQRTRELIGRTDEARAKTLVGAKDSSESGAVDLNPIVAVIHRGCMGLPQELVDYTMDMLHDDIQALKACSLTCKAMFASARRLIHQTLYLTERNSQRILTQEEKSRCQTWEYRAVNLRFLSLMDERGLLQYPREVYISMYRTLTPEILQPHLRRFRSLDRVHTLTLEHSDASMWAYHHKTYFAHFYPTLTSLTLRFPISNYRTILRFALHFPNLENLSIESYAKQSGYDSTVPRVVIDQYPPLSGRLRLLGNDTVAQWPVEFVDELPNGLTFRSLELLEFCREDPQHLLHACARTLENFTFSSREASYTELRRLVFSEMAVLRRFTFRLPFSYLRIFERDALIAALSTIASPVFCEFALALDELPLDFPRPSSEHWGRWELINKFLKERFATGGDFKFIICTDTVCHQKTFQRHARETFPLWKERGCLHFEMSSIYRTRY